MKPTPLLKFLSLRKTIAGQRLLDIPVLKIVQGTCLILSGKNGTGKTTLLKIIAGLEEPDNCDVCYQGKTMPWRLARRSYCHNVVYLHQAPYMFDRSVADNIAYGLRHLGLNRAEINTKVTTALEWAGLEHLAKRNARKLSGGEKQRVALARARVLSPRILLLDEPIASMDDESRERTYFLIRRLKSEHIGVVIISHELQRMSALGDQRAHLDGGRLHYVGVGPARQSASEMKVKATSLSVLDPANRNKRGNTIAPENGRRN